MPVSNEFHDQNYVPFTPAGLILQQLAEGGSWKEMQGLVAEEDFNGLYVRGKDGKVKRVLYDTYGILPKTPTYEAQQPYRNAISNDFNLEVNRLGAGETLVLHMSDADYARRGGARGGLSGPIGWCVEATVEAARRGPGEATFIFKHALGYGRFLYRNGCDDRGTYNYVIRGEGQRPAEGYSGPVEIHLIDKDFVDVKGSIDSVSWSPLPKQTLWIFNEDDSLVVLSAEPIDRVSSSTSPEDDYVYSVTEYENPDTREQPPRVRLQLKPTSWNTIMRFLNVHANRLSVS